MRAGVGGGDWSAVGEELAALLVGRGGLGRDDRMLDLGCGLGRVVQPLRSYLSRRASYLGVDVAPHYIAWNEAEIASRDPRFRFAWLDVHSAYYHAESGVPPEQAVLPVGDGEFDFALATSLLTHLDGAAVERYLAELARALRPGGRLLATFFVLDDEVRRRTGEVGTAFDFRHRLPGGGWTAFPERPEQATAFDEAWLVARLAHAGFELVGGVERGSWAGNPEAPTFQDLIVGRRAGSDSALR
ncbi:MAG: class I SAM-dependent methyltransferase [Thermoanaerobaculia bacterium]